MLTVHLRVNDAATGRPTPVRLRITGPDGTTFAPFGRLAEFAFGKNEDVGGHLLVGSERWCYIDGGCEVPLPAGVPLRVQATKGPEYTPLDATVTLGPGQMALRFTVARWSDVRADGWVPGDTRSHFLSPHAALLEAEAEDLAVANLLACVQPLPTLGGTVFDTLPNLVAFSGQKPALASDHAAVVVNTLNVHPALGTVGLLDSHRVVYPLTATDGDNDWSVCDWCDQCHRKGGLAVWVDPFAPAPNRPVGGEALVAAVLGLIDAIEYTGRHRTGALLPWVYRLWDAGRPVPLVGGSGKDSNRTALGTPRTYTKVLPTDPPGHAGWVAAVKAGRCYATDGPLLTFTVNGHGPGEPLHLPAAGVVKLEASVASRTPVERIEIVSGGKVIASGPDRLAVDHAVAESGWFAARVVGTGFAHTSPVVVRVGGAPLPRNPDAVAKLTADIALTREWVTSHGRFTDDRRRQQIVARCDRAAELFADR